MQQPTERTSLTRPNEQHSYVEFSGILRSRRNKIRQFQCCICATFIAAFIMALVVTISYSVNHPDVIPPETNVSQTDEVAETPANLLKLMGTNPSGLLKLGAVGLSDEEVKTALAAGNDAIAARRLADSMTNPLPSPSPNSRHQYAVSTSSKADQLAMAGVAELAATKKIENARSFMGKPTGFGSFLDGGWAPEKACTLKLDIQCPTYSAKYRRFDGSCNNPQQLGMAFSPYRRTLSPDYSDGIEAPRTGKFGNPLPSAREVSLKVHPPSPSTNPSFTVMLAVYGQFLDHDITATAISQGTNGSSLSCCPPSGSHPECFPVKVGPGDPVYDVAGSSCMEFVRSAPAAQCKIGPRQQLNQVTSFIDASTVYGSDIDTAESLREFSGGRLRMQTAPDQRQLLPASTNPNDGCNIQLELTRGRYCFATGDARANENLHLTTMHLLWARQHNLLARQLAQVNPQWDDEKLYQETRRIVGAQMQHITYQEFIPIVLGETEATKRGLKPLSTGFKSKNDTEVNPAIANHFAAAAFRFAHTLLPGLMKVTDAEKGTSSYVQLHKMLFNPYSLYSEGGVESSITTATSNAIQKTSTHVTSQLTEHLFEDPLGNQTTVPCGLDLVSLNIQRGRDHGLPGYVKWREYCGLRKPLKFEDLNGDMDPEALDSISKLYDNVEDVDLYTGALAEVPKGDGLLGPTFTCLIADQFERLQLGDKYWYENADQPGSFSEDQLKELRKISLARIICDTSDGITEVQAQVMRSVGTDNPMISCEDIPQLSFAAWKTEMPLLTLTETEVPVQDWLNFKSEVNKTIGDIVTNIMDKKPPPGSLPADWLAFQNDLNMTFSDLRNKFSALHPKIITNITLTRNLTSELDPFDWMSIKNDVDKTVADIMDSVAANKPPPGSLPADWLNYRKKINDSLIAIRKKFKVIHPIVKVSLKAKPKSDNLNLVGDIPTIDWAAIKNEINSTIMDVVGAINASKPLPGSLPSDWLAFRKKISDSLVNIKDKFAGLHPKPTPIPPSEKLDAVADGTPFDWMSIKNDVDKTVADIMDSVAANKPLPGSLPADWLNYRKKINDSLIAIRKKFKVIHPIVKDSRPKPDNLQLVGEIPTIDWTAIRSDINATIMDVVGAINASKPLPGSLPADWLAFRQKINDSLVNIKNKFAGLHPKPVPAEKLNAAADSTPFDWISIKNDVDKTVADIMDSVAANKPPPGSLPADWLNYRKKINDSLVDIRKKFKVIHPIVKDSRPKPDNLQLVGEIPTIDWTAIRNDINSTIMDVVGAINASKPLPGSLPADWLAFKQKINDSLANIKNKFAGLHPKPTPPVEQLNEADDGTTFDWVQFKDQLNKTLDDIIASTVSKKPPAGSTPADWLAFQKQLNTTFAEFVNQFSGLHPKPVDYKKFKLKLGDSKPVSTENDLNAKNNVDDAPVDIAAVIKANMPPPGSPQEDWLVFKQKMNATFANMTNKYSKYANQYPKKPAKTYVKLSESAVDPTFDVVAFRENLNKSLSDLVSLIKTKKPAIDSPMTDWLAYKKDIKASIAKIKDQFSAFKMKELLEPDYLEYSTEKDAAFDWVGWKSQIDKTIDGLLVDVKTIPPGDDPKWASFRDYLNKSFTDLKNNVAVMKTTKPQQAKLLAIMQEDFLGFKDQINSTIEDTLDDINFNKPAPGDPAWLTYGLYIKKRFTEMKADLVASKAEWFDKVKVATEMMTVTNVNAPAASSASSLKAKLLSTKNYLKICVTFILITFLIN